MQKSRIESSLTITWFWIDNICDKIKNILLSYYKNLLIFWTILNLDLNKKHPQFIITRDYEPLFTQKEDAFCNDLEIWHAKLE